MKIFTDLGIALFCPKKYTRFYPYKGHKPVWCLFRLIALVLVIEFYFMGIFSLVDYIPELTISGGKLTSEYVKYEVEGSRYIEIDTTDSQSWATDEDALNELLDAYDNVFLSDSERLIAKSAGRIQQLEYSAFGNETITRGTLVSFFYFGVGFGVIVGAWWKVLVSLIVAAVVAIFAKLAASHLKVDITFKKLLKLSLYAIAPQILLELIVFLLPFYVPFIDLVAYAISLAYVIIAIKQIGTDIQMGKADYLAASTGAYRRVWSTTDDEQNPYFQVSQTPEVIEPEVIAPSSAEDARSDENIQPSTGFSFGEDIVIDGDTIDEI